jgi:hypothetical protein
MNDAKSLLCTTAHKVKNTTKAPTPKNTELWEAVRLVAAVDDRKAIADLQRDFAHIPTYLSLIDNPAALVEAINKEFATIAYDDNSRTPISKVATIAKTLPNTKVKISNLYDSDSRQLTSHYTPTSTY